MKITMSGVAHGIERLEIPEYVTNVGYYCCNGQPRLVEIIFPKGLRTIEPEAFQSCKALRSVV